MKETYPFPARRHNIYILGPSVKEVNVIQHNAYIADRGTKKAKEQANESILTLSAMGVPSSEDINALHHR